MTASLPSPEDIVGGLLSTLTGEEAPRRYIGASIIGSQCEALVAFNMRGFPGTEIPPRLKRIFDLGHVIEDVIVRELAPALGRQGIKLITKDPETGKQFAADWFGGIVSCHLDGMLFCKDEALAVFEAKSMNSENFETFKAFGVASSHPKYLLQMMLCMAMFSVPKALFFAYNKDNSDCWCEWVSLNPIEVAYLLHMIGWVMEGKARRIAKDKTDWRCKGCFKATACWDGVVGEPKCAKCMYSKPDMDGNWFCTSSALGMPPQKVDPDSWCGLFKPYEPHPEGRVALYTPTVTREI